MCNLKISQPLNCLLFAAEDCQRAIELLRGGVDEYELIVLAYLQSAKSKMWYQGHKERNYWETGDENGEPKKKTRKRRMESPAFTKMTNDPEMGLVSEMGLVGALEDLWQAQKYDPDNASVNDTMYTVKACLNSLIAVGVSTIIRFCEVIIDPSPILENSDPELLSFGLSV